MIQLYPERCWQRHVCAHVHSLAAAGTPEPGCVGVRAVGLSCLTLIIGRFSRHYRELRFQNTIIPLPYVCSLYLELRSLKILLVLPCIWLAAISLVVGVQAAVRPPTIYSP